MKKEKTDEICELACARTAAPLKNRVSHIYFTAYVSRIKKCSAVFDLRNEDGFFFLLHSLMPPRREKGKEAQIVLVPLVERSVNFLFL